MKKSDIALIIGVIVVIIIGVFFMGGSETKLDYELPLELTGEPGLTKLSYDEYEEKIANGEAFVVVIERAGCSHCVNYMPVAEDFAKTNNVPMYYIDTDEMDDEDWDSISTSNTFFKKNKEWGTPTTIVLLGNKALDYIVGETDSESLQELYEEYFDVNIETEESE